MSKEENKSKQEQLRTVAAKKRFLKALESSLCNISLACQGAGISRQTYYDWRRDDHEFANQASETKESLVDIMEDKLVQTALEGNITALIFYLKKNRAKRYGDNPQGEIEPEQRQYFEIGGKKLWF